jgi:hypothetical protein
VRQRSGANAQIADGRIYIGADPAQSRSGDLRISYNVAARSSLRSPGYDIGRWFRPACW